VAPAAFIDGLEGGNPEQGRATFPVDFIARHFSVERGQLRHARSVNIGRPPVNDKQ